MMIKINKKQTYKITLYVIGGYQILGSLVGLNFLFKDGAPLLLRYPIAFLLIFVVFLFGAYCGGMLFKQEKTRGINLSLLNQSFQLVQFKLFGYGLEFVSGTYLAIGLTNKPNFSFYYYQADIRAVFYFTFRGSGNENFFLINLIALFIFILLLYIKEKY